MKFNFIEKSVTPYVETLIKEMKLFMPEKNVKIIASIGKMPVMEVDPDKIIQVLRNLVDNAIKFSQQNGKLIITAGKKSWRDFV